MRTIYSYPFLVAFALVLSSCGQAPETSSPSSESLYYNSTRSFYSMLQSYNLCILPYATWDNARGEEEILKYKDDIADGGILTITIKPPLGISCKTQLAKDAVAACNKGLKDNGSPEGSSCKCGSCSCPNRTDTSCLTMPDKEVIRR